MAESESGCWKRMNRGMNRSFRSKGLCGRVDEAILASLRMPSTALAWTDDADSLLPSASRKSRRALRGAPDRSCWFRFAPSEKGGHASKFTKNDLTRFSLVENRVKELRIGELSLNPMSIEDCRLSIQKEWVANRFKRDSYPSSPNPFATSLKTCQPKGEWVSPLGGVRNF